LESEFHQRVRDIVDDRVHGSTKIALNLLTFLSEKLVYLEISQARKVLDETLRIVKKRPSIILPANLVYTLNEAANLSTSRGIKPDIRRITELLLSSYNQKIRKAVENAVDVLRGYRKIFTLSYSSQVISTLKEMLSVEVSVVAGWPILDGARAFKELTSHGARVRVYPDSSIYEAVSSSEAALLGCDAVLLDGSAINRSGSKVAALICYEKSIPVYVICDSMKLDFQSIWKPETWNYKFEGIEMDFQLLEKVESGLISRYIYDLGQDTPRDFVEKALREIRDYPYKLIL
jgi:translation initiation factor 2B subunit (eIF-2B alpha/beta/delta family)